MSDLVIEVRELSKRYRIGLKEKKAQTFADQLANVIKAPIKNFRQLTRMTRFGEEDESVFWALKNINFSVKEGEVLGIIGRNGAGKSTLLKILSRITEPTSGEGVIKGRVASLLEVGTGFHPELTGRENIYMNGTILGMTKKEIDHKLDEIIDFSGVEKFVDTPVKFYSSGMKVRLGFSVAAHLEPEILIIDEVLAVGDYEFQKKCLGKMEDVAKHGRTVLFVSHNMAAVENLCTSGIVLADGSIVHSGVVSDSIAKYMESSNDNILRGKWTNDKNDKRKIIELASATLNIFGQQPNLKLEVNCNFCSNKNHKDVFVAFDILNEDGWPIFQAIPTDKPFIKYSSDQIVTAIIELPPLIPGLYKLSIWAGSHYSQTFDWQQEILSFAIDSSPMLGRTHPHSKRNGYLIPNSYIIKK